jgi:ribosomal protein S18 acetylase RimI-like enzyme
VTAPGSRVDVAPCVAGELPHLLGLAMGVFGDLPGWSDRRVVEALLEDAVFVAHREGRVVGYVALGRDADDEIVVEQLFVAPGYERQGIGRRLLAHAEGFAISERGRSLRIVVETSNWIARGFYERSGFVPIGPELYERVLPRTS